MMLHPKPSGRVVSRPLPASPSVIPSSLVSTSWTVPSASAHLFALLKSTLRRKRRRLSIWARCEYCTTSLDIPLLTFFFSTSLEINHKSQDVVKKSQAGAGVAVKIEHAVYESAKMFGRHFDEKDEIYSHITRQSIDVLKASFKQDVSTEEWLLIKALKPVCTWMPCYFCLALIDVSFSASISSDFCAFRATCRRTYWELRITAFCLHKHASVSINAHAIA